MEILNSEQFIKKTYKINEGAGAGYDITLEGLAIDKNSIEIIGGDAPFGKANNMVAFWKADIVPCAVDKWKAIGYYEGMTSDGDDESNWPYSDEDKQVNGGYIVGVVHLDDVEDYMKADPHEEKVVIDYIKECINDKVDVSYNFGGGWVHVNLDDVFKLGYGLDYKNLKNFEYGMVVRNGSRGESLSEIGYAGGEYDGINILYAEIDSPNIAYCINYYFEHCDDEDIPADGVNESMVNGIHCLDIKKELSGLRKKVVDSLKGILAKTHSKENNKTPVSNVGDIGYVWLEWNNVFVSENGNKVNIDTLANDEVFDVYQSVCNSLREIEGVRRNMKIEDVDDFVQNHQEAFDMFSEICKNKVDYPDAGSVLDAVKNLYINGDITVEECGFIVGNFDELEKMVNH